MPHTFKDLAELNSTYHAIETRPPFEYDGDFNGGDPQTRIWTTMQINGRWFHYTAIEVQADARTAVNPDLQPKLDALTLLAGADADDFRVITVAGRHYVEYLVPFCL